MRQTRPLPASHVWHEGRAITCEEAMRLLMSTMMRFGEPVVDAEARPVPTLHRAITTTNRE